MTEVTVNGKQFRKRLQHLNMLVDFERVVLFRPLGCFICWGHKLKVVCLSTKLNHKKMGTLQFYIPGFQNDPSYPKQKEFLKSTEGNLK